MKLLFRLVVGGLVLLFVIAISLAALGAVLPPGHTATRSARFRQSPAALFAVASDFAAQPSWRRGLQRVEMLPAANGQARYREISGRRAITFAVVESDPRKKFATRIDQVDLPFGGTWTYEFLPAADGAIVRITEQGEVKNLIFRALARFVFGYTSSMDDYLRDLGNKFGETVTPSS